MQITNIPKERFKTYFRILFIISISYLTAFDSIIANNKLKRGLNIIVTR
jgi:hypothetical protein